MSLSSLMRGHTASRGSRCDDPAERPFSGAPDVGFRHTGGTEVCSARRLSVGAAPCLTSRRQLAHTLRPTSNLSDFTLTERHRSGLRAADAGERPPFELTTAGRPLCEDLAALPEDAEYVATRGNAAGLARLPVAPHIFALWATAVTPALVRTLPTIPGLRALSLYQIGKADLGPLAGLASVEHLLISWAHHLVDLSWLARLPKLRTLYLDDLKRVDLDTLPGLPALRALHLGGGMWSTLKVASFAPLRRVPNLRYLQLSNVKPIDGSLEPLAALRGLRELLAPNVFEVEECARLSAALPGVDGRILGAIFAEASLAADGRPLFQCERCGGPRLMLTGRPAAQLCPRCDAARIAKRVARWEIARASATAGAT